MAQLKSLTYRSAAAPRRATVACVKSEILTLQQPAPKHGGFAPAGPRILQVLNSPNHRRRGDMVVAHLLVDNVRRDGREPGQHNVREGVASTGPRIRRRLKVFPAGFFQIDLIEPWSRPGSDSAGLRWPAAVSIG